MLPREFVPTLTLGLLAGPWGLIFGMAVWAWEKAHQNASLWIGIALLFASVIPKLDTGGDSTSDAAELRSLWWGTTPDSHTAWDVILTAVPCLGFSMGLYHHLTDAAGWTPGFWERFMPANPGRTGQTNRHSSLQSVEPQRQWTQRTGPRNLFLLLGSRTAKGSGKWHTVWSLNFHSWNWVSYS